MANVGAVYSINRFRRTADDVAEELHRWERAVNRPQPQHKQVLAELTEYPQGVDGCGRKRTFIELAVACHTREIDHQKPSVCLLDGE